MKQLLTLSFIVTIWAVSITAEAANGPVTCAIKTYNGHYLTAVGGGGRTTDVIHSDTTRIGAWEKFTLIDSGGI